MSAVTKKPPPSTTPNSRRTMDPSASSPTASRTPVKSPANSLNGNVPRTTQPARTRAPVSARAAIQRPSVGAPKMSSENVEAHEEARAERDARIEELTEKLNTAETTSEKFQREALVLQTRLDEALSEQGKLEEKLHESDEKVEALENEKREVSRQFSQMESIYEAERSSMTKEKEAWANREEEMQAVIQRLKDNLASRSNNDNDESRLSRRTGNLSPSTENGDFAPPSEVTRSDSRNSSKLVLQKDRQIEQLRLDLAEAHVKLVEAENMGGGRFQEMEKVLLETRMTNARLMEDNESFQLLLSEKTLNGEFSNGYLGSQSNADALSALEGRAPSLADELSEAGEGESENYRRLEAELKAAKDQNKALTLYINKIIERLLMHQDFETILDQSSDFKPPMTSHKDKELPAPPQASGFITRAKSVLAPGAGAAATTKARPRPMSQMPASRSALTDPDTAPSIPFGLNRSSSFGKSKRRPMSEQYTSGGAAAANVVNQMYRGPASPPLHGPQTPRNSASFFSPPPAAGNPNAAARHPSGNSVPTVSTGVMGNFPGEKKGERSETSSISSSTGEVTTPPSTSPPRSEKEMGQKTTFAGGNKPRPLRLVNENEATKKAEEAAANKRASWINWSSWGAKKDESIPE